MDAAVAVSFALAVLQPHLGGLGGDYFALENVGGNTVFIDGSGPAPRSQTINEMPAKGPHTITIPGMIDALWIMWKKHGSLSWHNLLVPAISLAEKGYPVHRELRRAVNANKEILSATRQGIRFVSMTESGYIRLPETAEALRRLAEDPRDFYEGDIAGDIVETVSGNGGFLEIDDLSSYRASLREPIQVRLGTVRVMETPPPTQGVTSLIMLQLLRDAYEEKPPRPLSRRRALLHLEAARLSYCIRDKYVTDPRYMNIDVTRLLRENPNVLCREPGWVSGGAGHGSGDTTYYIVVDEDGRYVSGIQSLYNHFGSGMITGRYLIPLNNRGRDFALDPDHVNSLQPGKRTRHTLSTVVAETSNEALIIGTSGGNLRPQIHALLYTNHRYLGMSPWEALNWPRLLWDPHDGIVYEEGWEWSGGVVKAYPSRMGVASTALVRGREAYGYTDPRGVGTAIGIP